MKEKIEKLAKQNDLQLKPKSLEDILAALRETANADESGQESEGGAGRYVPLFPAARTEPYLEFFGQKTKIRNSKVVEVMSLLEKTRSQKIDL